MARPPSAPPSRPRNCNHHIQLYTAEESLYHSICSFVLPSFFSQNHAAVIVATQAHLDALDSYLRSQNLTLDLMTKREQLVIAPAEPILEHLIPDGVVSADRFKNYFAPLCARLQRKYPRLLVYGELVNMLCERDEHETALELELVWEEFLVGKEISLLCGYNFSAFVSDGLDDVFSRICSAHSHVAPAADSDFVGRIQDIQTVIAILQHRTLRLDAEISRRYAVEETLRATLAHLGSRPTDAIAVRDTKEPGVVQMRLPPVGIVAATCTPTGTEYFCNSRFLELAGVQNARDWVSTVYYKDRDRVTHTLRLADRRSRSCEYRFVLPSGALRYMAGESEAREDGYVHSAVDITSTRPPSPTGTPYHPETARARKHRRSSPSAPDAKEDITNLLWTLLFPTPRSPATVAILEAWKCRLDVDAAAAAAAAAESGGDNYNNAGDHDEALAIYHACHLILSSPPSTAHAKAIVSRVSHLTHPGRVAAGVFFLAAPVVLINCHPPMDTTALWDTVDRCRRFRPDEAEKLERGRWRELVDEERVVRVQDWIDEPSRPGSGKRHESDQAGVSRELERLFQDEMQ